MRDTHVTVTNVHGTYEIHRNWFDVRGVIKRWRDAGSFKEGIVRAVPAASIRLTEKQFDALVSRWNHLSPTEKRQRTAQCTNNGHDWIEASFSVPGDITYVCQRCMKYDTAA